MSELNGSFGQADGLVGTLDTDKSLVGQLGGSLIPGPKGDKGDKGDTGATGPIGPAGPQGDQGPQGETGPKGDKGDTGERGETGATGPMGPQGDRGLKGDKGDDYVLTQADKQEIAGLVDTPVDDVLINGTSIVQDGVVDIPKAGPYTYGVVKINTSGGNTFGIGINANGQLHVSPASSNAVKNGTNSYKPVCASLQHESTFYGLAKAAGADEKDSTLPVGTYTEEAKAAIRTMLGIDKESLVAEIRDALNL